MSYTTVSLEFSNSMKKAIVLGSGIGGILSAKVLSDYFDEVLIVDKKKELQGKSVQSQHLHVMLASGRELLEGFFPGIDKKLADRGAPLIDWARDTSWTGAFGIYPQYESRIITRSASRALIEELIFEEIIKNKKVKFMGAFEFSNFITENNKIVAIQSKNKTQLEGDFYINSMGRQNPLKTNQKIKVDAAVTYTSIELKNKNPVKLPGSRPGASAAPLSFFGRLNLK